MALTLEQAKEKAIEATRRADAIPHAVINLNRIGSPMYVVRSMRGCPKGKRLSDNVVFIVGLPSVPESWPGMGEAMSNCITLGFYLERPQSIEEI